MGSRDHSTTCEACGMQRGGLNDYKCRCDEKPTIHHLIVMLDADCNDDDVKSIVKAVQMVRGVFCVETRMSRRRGALPKAVATDSFGAGKIIEPTSDQEGQWLVECDRCGKPKAPRGCVPVKDAEAEDYCMRSCAGYEEWPYPSTNAARVVSP